jgi:tRNA(Ile)-lysidine synthase
MLPRTVRRTIEKYGMFSQGDRVVVAVSGGPDSVALLHILDALKDVYGIKLHAAHLEHGLRGEESEGDMKFVESLCDGLSIPLTVGSEDVGAVAKLDGLSVEAAARKVRYGFLDEVLEDTGFKKLATGHNANDQAETVLINLMRGSGIAGLSGMKPAMGGKVVRPLIEARRAEIMAYLEQKKIEYRTDSSNSDTRFDRNKVRGVLIPLIEKEFNPSIVDSLARTASVFSMVYEYFKDQVEKSMQAAVKTEEGRATLNLELFNSYPDIVKLFTFHRILRSLEDDEQVISYDTLSALLNVADKSRSGSRIDIGCGIIALKEFNRIVIGRDLALYEPYEVPLNVPGETAVEGTGYVYRVEVLKERPGTGDVYRSGESAYFDFSELALPLVARNWREGDRFVPFGLKGTKKVHDVFIDEKVPVSQRTKIPLVCDADGVIWVTGVRRADRARVNDKTDAIVKITYSTERRATGREAGEQRDE